MESPRPILEIYFQMEVQPIRAVVAGWPKFPGRGSGIRRRQDDARYSRTPGLRASRSCYFAGESPFFAGNSF